MFLQKELRALIGERCFVRVCKTADALWISDIPRRDERLDEARSRLAQGGFRSWVDERGMLRIDLDERRYAALFESLPRQVPTFPSDEQLLQAYQLIRLLSLHADAADVHPLEPIREALKRMEQPTLLLKWIPSLTQDCAERLRRREPLPCAIGGLLYQALF